MAIVFRRLAAILALALAVPCAARADDGTNLRANVLTAMAATQSFVVDLSNPQGISGNAVVITRLGSTKVQGSAGPHSLLLYAIGAEAYMQIDGGAWQRRAVPAGFGMSLLPLAQAASVTPQADGRDGSGTFAVVAPLPIPGIGTIPNVATTCTYDKSTMRLRTCANQYATLTFHGYDDPKNAVELPPDARNATELPPLDASGLR
jgi:hypothetical protein